MRVHLYKYDALRPQHLGPEHLDTLDGPPNHNSALLCVGARLAWRDSEWLVRDVNRSGVGRNMECSLFIEPFSTIPVHCPVWCSKNPDGTGLHSEGCPNSCGLDESADPFFCVRDPGHEGPCIGEENEEEAALRQLDVSFRRANEFQQQELGIPYVPIFPIRPLYGFFSELELCNSEGRCLRRAGHRGPHVSERNVAIDLDIQNLLEAVTAEREQSGRSLDHLHTDRCGAVGLQGRCTRPDDHGGDHLVVVNGARFSFSDERCPVTNERIDEVVGAQPPADNIEDFQCTATGFHGRCVRPAEHSEGTHIVVVDGFRTSFSTDRCPVTNERGEQCVLFQSDHPVDVHAYIHTSELRGAHDVQVPIPPGTPRFLRCNQFVMGNQERCWRVLNHRGACCAQHEVAARMDVVAEGRARPIAGFGSFWGASFYISDQIDAGSTYELTAPQNLSCVPGKVIGMHNGMPCYAPEDLRRQAVIADFVIFAHELLEREDRLRMIERERARERHVLDNLRWNMMLDGEIL